MKNIILLKHRKILTIFKNIQGGSMGKNIYSGQIIKYWEEKRVSMQHMGIDRNIIVRSDQKTLLYKIEEKIRRKFYNDFLFEFISNDTYPSGDKKNIGWIKKNLKCNFLVFYFIENDKFFLFNWEVLQLTYEKFGPKWIEKAINNKEGFRIVYAKNKTRNGMSYCSHNLIVPANELVNAYKEVYSTTK